MRATFRSAGLSLGVGTALTDRNALSGSTKEMTQAELAEASAPGGERPVAQARAFGAAYHRRLAAPLAVLAFALMAVPLAAMRRGGRAAAIGASVGAVLARSTCCCGPARCWRSAGPSRRRWRCSSATWC